ncbi:hypothetical protein DFH06DRAFT_1482062 [Mycena polygramma]|nr:hypothetical protein DFH06DRAFT_1482062 [Mycena polygramma]
MHPSLQLSALDVLPFTSRRMALSAARGTLKDVKAVYARTQAQGNDKISPFLPVFHACLDESRIPAEELLDIPSTFTEGAVCCAEISLESLNSMVLSFGPPIHPDAIPDLWPRLWAWVQFIDTFREQFPGDGAAGSGFINLVSSFTNWYKPHLVNTPGLRRVIVGAWAPVQGCENPLRVAVGTDALTTVLFSELKPRNRADVEEVVMGAGGSLADVAELVIGYLDRIALDGGTRQLKRERRLEGTIFDFINDVDRIMAQVARDRSVLGPFMSALLSCGVVPSLTTMLKNLLPLTTRFQELFILFQRSLVSLTQILRAAPGRQAMLDALNTGLLQVIVLSGTHNEFDPTVKSLIEDVLQSTLLNYYELTSLDYHLPVATALIQTETFQTSALLDSWNRFLALASERIVLLLNRDDESRLRACDNTRCRKVEPKAQFQRCSGCLSFYYCSPECQRADWRDGNHRSHCSRYHPQRLSEMQGLKVRQRSFLRALMTYDYNEAMHKHRQQVLLSPQNDSQPFFTLFDYRPGRVQIEVQPMDSPLAERLGQHSGWGNDALRAARSGGRMELCVLALPGHSGTQFFVVPCAQRGSPPSNV